MRTSSLLPILRSQLQGELLALLYLHQNDEYSLTDAASRIGATVRAVHHEVGRLADAGLVTQRRHGNLRLIKAADTRMTRPLTELLALSYGPLEVVPHVLDAVDGIRDAYIFGSWARRYRGESGPPPDDVDVLVVGTADLDDLDDAGRRAEAELLRPVHIVRVLPQRWDDVESHDGFLADLSGKPLVPIALEKPR